MFGSKGKLFHVVTLASDVALISFQLISLDQDAVGGHLVALFNEYDVSHE